MPGRRDPSGARTLAPKAINTREEKPTTHSHARHTSRTTLLGQSFSTCMHVRAVQSRQSRARKTTQYQNCAPAAKGDDKQACREALGTCVFEGRVCTPTSSEGSDCHPRWELKPSAAAAAAAPMYTHTERASQHQQNLCLDCCWPSAADVLRAGDYLHSSTATPGLHGCCALLPAKDITRLAPHSQLNMP